MTNSYAAAHAAVEHARAATLADSIIVAHRCCIWVSFHIYVGLFSHVYGSLFTCTIRVGQSIRATLNLSEWPTGAI